MWGGVLFALVEGAVEAFEAGGVAECARGFTIREGGEADEVGECREGSGDRSEQEGHGACEGDFLDNPGPCEPGDGEDGRHGGQFGVAKS